MAEPCKYCGRQSPVEPRPSSAQFCLPCALRCIRLRFFPYFTRLHRRLFLWFYVLFALLIFFLLLPDSLRAPGGHLQETVWTSILAFAGPYTGLMARGFSYAPPRLVHYCYAAVAGGVFLQLVPLPLGRIERWVRILAWCLGLLGWFAASLFSTIST